MPLNIDITDLKSREIIRLLNSYPNGHLENKYDRVFWVSDYNEPVHTSEEPPRMPQNMGVRPLSPGNKASRGFAAAADALGRMVC